MWKESISVAVGVGIGILVAKAIYNASKKQLDKPSTVELKNDVQMKFKDFSGLLQEQLVIENLSGDELVKWFRENAMLEAEDINKIIAYPTKEILNGLGYEFVDELDTKKSIIQTFYDTDKEEILKLRFISFAEIDSELKNVLQKDGMLVIE